MTSLAPGGRPSLDDRSCLFPIAHLGELRPGIYAVQALLHTNPDLNFPNAPGDLYSEAQTVRLDPAAGGTVALELSRGRARRDAPRRHRARQVPQDPLRAARATSTAGRSTSAPGVILPRDFAREPDRRYPLRVHIGGYGARFTGVGRAGWRRDRNSAASGWPTTRRG